MLFSSSVASYVSAPCGASPDPRTPMNSGSPHAPSAGAVAGVGGLGLGGAEKPIQGVTITPAPATGVPSPIGDGPDASPQSTPVASTQVFADTRASSAGTDLVDSHVGVVRRG